MGDDQPFDQYAESALAENITKFREITGEPNCYIIVIGRFSLENENKEMTFDAATISSLDAEAASVALQMIVEEVDQGRAKKLTPKTKDWWPFNRKRHPQG